MNKRLWYSASGAGIGLLIAMIATAAEPEPEAAIRLRVRSYVEAFNRHDADALADHWLENAVYFNRDTGRRTEGRGRIREAFRSLFEKDDSLRLRLDIERLELIDEKVAVEDGIAVVTSSVDPPSVDKYTAVHRKENGVWYLHSVRACEADAAESTSEAPLSQLAWLIGQWIDRDEETTVRMKCQWTKNQSFITRSFRVEVAGDAPLEGTQVIGWDPAEKTIRSWTFDSDGGFARATWTRDADRWEIRRSAVLPDGRKGSSVSILRYIDDRTYGWQVFDREVDGEFLPSVKEVIIQRVDDEATGQAAGS